MMQFSSKIRNLTKQMDTHESEAVVTGEEES